jgi:hypothetical protein
LLYTIGISRFAEVFFAFESAWISQLDRLGGVGSSDSREYDVLDSFVGDEAGRIRRILSQIYDPELLRSDRLRSDLLVLRSLISNSEHGQRGSWDDGDTSKEGNAELANSAVAFASHIKSSLDCKPHILLAYAWVMYMATFDVGVHIRRKQLAAGTDFWGQASASMSPSDDQSDISNGLSFWFFPGNQEDETIKMKFQQRLLNAFSLLTATEWVDVIWAAIDILEWCAKILHEIDVEVARVTRRARCSHHGARGRFSSFISSLPSASSFWPQSKVTSRPPARMDLRPLLAGIVGCLGGLCMWLLKR